jgi:hypothetical protein
VIGNVTWTTPGQSSADSLPIGNGDLAANVWTEPNGDILLYVAKNDAWDHLGRLLKIGRLRLTLKPGLDPTGQDFAQHLALEEGAVIAGWLEAHLAELLGDVAGGLAMIFGPGETAAHGIGGVGLKPRAHGGGGH